MSRIYFSICLAAACCLICAGCRSGAGDVSPVLICQLRVAKSVSPNPKTTRINLFTSSGADAHFLWGYHQKVQKEDGRFFVFDPDDFLLDTDSRRAVVLDDFSAPQQVFRLRLPRRPKRQDWSAWQRPDLLVRGDVGWAFMYDQKIRGVVTNISAD